MRPRYQLVLVLVALGAAAPARARNVKIHWSPIKGANQYELQVLLNGKAVKNERIPSDSTSWGGDMPPGAYLYQVRGVDRLEQPGKWSAFQAFLVAPPAPSPIAPEKNSEWESSPTAKVKLKWAAVAGANRYLAEIKYGKRSVFKKTVATTETESTPLGPGKYTWSVRALVELKDKPPKGTDLSRGQGPWSENVAFTVLPAGAKRGLASQSEMQWTPRSRQMTLDLDLAGGSYKYTNDSPNAQNDGSTSSFFTGVEAALGYQITKDWRAGLALELNFFKINEVSFNRKAFELVTGYSFAVTDSVKVIPEGGLRLQDYFSFQRADASSAASLTGVMAGGPTLGVRVAMEISARQQWELFGRYNLPSKLLSAPAGTTIASGGANYAVGVNGRYFLGPDWALHLQLAYRNTPLSYTLSGQTAPEATTYSAVQGLVGVSFQLGSDLR